MAAGFTASAQAQDSATPQAPAAAPAAAPADQSPPAAKPWKIGPMEVSGFLDSYYSLNPNDPTETDNGKMNDYYNFNQDANQPSLSAAKLTLNHDPAPIGLHIDAIYGRTNRLINATNQLYFVEQSFLSVKPAKWKGLEIDGGKFVTAAGAETIEAKDNWNYSRSLLFAWAIPYWHFGGRASMPVNKVETVGLQVVNGWNNITHNVGGPTIGITSALTLPKYTWSANVYTGAADVPGQKGYRNLFDTTLLLTPNTKLNAYINFDVGQQKNTVSSTGQGTASKSNWYGFAMASHYQLTGTMAAAARYEDLDDTQGAATGTAQNLQEVTGTYEYKWKYGFLGRLEYRHDWSSQPSFHKENGGMSDAQTTFTTAIILVIAPKR